MIKEKYISKTHLCNKSNVNLKKPRWIKVRAPVSKNYHASLKIVNELNLNTVCQEAACPNIGECWSKKHVTVMILGRVCTRKCTFCNIATGVPDLVDTNEPENIAKVSENIVEKLLESFFDRWMNMANRTSNDDQFLYDQPSTNRNIENIENTVLGNGYGEDKSVILKSPSSLRSIESSLTVGEKRD